MQKHRFLYSIVYFLFLFISLDLINAQSIEELYSPLLLGRGTNPVIMESPVGDIFNPAASALNQRITLDLSYIALPGFGEESGYGQAANLGITLPTKFGVFNSSFHFISSPFPGTNLGTMTAFNNSFSKDLFPNLLIGLGLNAMIGSQGETIDWGLGADIGFIHLIDKWAVFKDFRWGITMRGMGKAYEPSNDNRLFPQSFTPSLGAYGKLIKNDNFSLALLSDLAVPFTNDVNINLSLSTELVFGNFISLYAALNFDLLEIQDDDTTRLPFTFGGTMKFNLSGRRDGKPSKLAEKGWDRSEINVNLVAAPLQNGVWGIGGGVNIPLGVIDKEPPQVTMDTAEEVYVSPNVDGTQDDFILPLKIDEERYVKGYKLVITDQAGQPVKEIANKDERPENVSFKTVIDRLFYVKKGIQVPETIRWDGKSDTGVVVPNGEYSYALETWDDNGNVGKTAPRKIIIDSEAPAAGIKTDYLVFSPNNDGNKDVLPLKQEGSVENLWEGQIKDLNGNVVNSFSWENAQPQPFEWNGKNKDGILAADGVYHYVLTSKDKAGNSASFPVDNIIISTEATPININIDKSHISPNSDGTKDTVRFTFDIPVTKGIEKWSLKILDPAEKSFRTFTGNAQVPELIDFDGQDDAGKVLKEGTYKGVLNVLYLNGNNPLSTTPEFVVDLTPPEARVNADYTIFSPNNDGNKDSVTIAQETTLEVTWEGEIKNEQDKVVKRFLWKGVADAKLEWQAKGDDGLLLPDGVYGYYIRSVDKAGNVGESNRLNFRVDTKETPVFLTTDSNYFSPNVDGVSDVISIIPHLSIASDIEQYTLSIKDNAQQLVKAFKGKGKAPESFKWDGKDENSKRVADGSYTAEFNLLYSNGNNPKANTNQFIIDTQYPVAEISVDYTLFSPDNDGERDRITVSQKSSNEELWEGVVLNSQNAVIKSHFWKGEATSYSWDGKDELGNKIPNGTYTYQLSSTDRAGNKTVKIIKAIELDSTPTPVFVTVDSEGFSPNKDNVLDMLNFQLFVTNKKGIKSWILEIMHEQAGVQRTFSGTTEVTEKIRWDGSTDSKDNKPAAEGNYYARLTVEYSKGNKPVEKTKNFRLDVTAPEVTLTMAPTPFSPDNDGIEDEMTITTKVKDRSAITQWKLEILDPMNQHFTTFKGIGIPSEKIIWDGVSDTGVLVEAAEDYPMEFTISDDLGNKAVLKGIIPIDVLVMRFGDKLKIRIPSITFAPGEADYVNVEVDRATKNQKTLQRLAQIFNKYKDYNIKIEGHALNFFYQDPVKAAQEDKEVLLPLSIERAKVIKNGLVKFGIDAARITTEGFGSSQPMVPFSDINNRWKNRRVEFILIKK